MSFGESVFSAGFIQKTKADLHVRINRAYPPWNGHQKVPEDTTRKQEPKGWPHLQAAQPLGPPVILHLVMSVSLHLLGCISTVP
jgi:hypothetical protein